MANELAIIEPIQPPANPDQLPSWPAWLQRRNAELESGIELHSLELPTLPKEMLLNFSERAMVEGHIAALSQFLDLRKPFVHREKVMTNDQGNGVLIAGLLIKGKGARLDEASSDALTEAYLDAIEDLPAWAVRKALRKWNRGESVQIDPRKPHDFSWRPEPPTVRYLALVELAGIRWEILRLKRLLAAMPRPSEADMAAGRAALDGLNRMIKAGDLTGAASLTFEAAIALGNTPQLAAPVPAASQAEAAE
jgi:hypothetical protein